MRGRSSNFLKWFPYFIVFIYYFTLPVLWTTLIWFKLFKPKEQALSIKELKSIIHYYTEKGTIHSMEEEMIAQLLSIKKKTVKDILVKKDIPLKLNHSSKIKKYRKDIVMSKNKIYTVYEKNEIKGIAFYKDLADMLLNEDILKPKVSDCLKSAFFINIDDDIFEAIIKFKKNKDRYAIVVNSDNDVQGVVTAKQVYTYALK